MRKYITSIILWGFITVFLVLIHVFGRHQLIDFTVFHLNTYVYVILGTTTIKGLENLRHPTQAKKILNMWRRIVVLLHFYDGRNQIIFLSNRKLYYSFFLCCCYSFLQWDVNLWNWGNISNLGFVIIIYNFNDWIHTIIL